MINFILLLILLIVVLAIIAYVEDSLDKRSFDEIRIDYYRVSDRSK